MDWTLDQLNAFVISVQQGSFSAAARRLGKAQSRISTAISNLEADLGFELFDRSARLPILTPEGQQMYEEAKVVLAQCERLQSRALTLTQGEEVTLTIAMDEASPLTAFEDFFQRVSETFPLLKLTIINGSKDDIATRVDEEMADIGILFFSKTLPSSLEFTPICEFNSSLIVGKNHSLAQISAPTVQQLSQHRQLLICDRSGRHHSEALSANYWQIDSYYSITSFVLRNMGWAFVPDHVFTYDFFSEGVVKLSMENIPASQWIEMGVVKRRDRATGPVIKWIQQELKKMFTQ
ncbi:LysR family transcriptional regulator [Photobacterium sp. GB-27]|uniref:LysR family transcriptional regulator n=1 Tax=Photobacterium sp. GB-27 TaxID=2022109 RepID=UPI000D161F32|nr:LysR family transcriptional regulator [Photobacterium sp. GB-27]PSV38279.1 LysR family transcriptional regulator [Photobacterium sp. GB-27]